ncbi:hypothetical protein ASE86_10135 [Sphingomonas sp. Leaf33]|uniref:hypothetical protein n=1 Tax=Sphingomonas sp. Leaf33 TaxID=1736215 RepID=UPI0006F4D135|nr:hypothetical protein [Sphingomonas sp. Leaf33]KQN26456.1 hypothetical protein ASE86_10135 [Sphingomonas sp. Leaf33]
MNLFLLLTAMLSALTGVGRAVDARAHTGVEASRVIAAAQVVSPAIARSVAPRPDGYVAPAPLILDLTRALDALRPVAPERRRE